MYLILLPALALAAADWLAVARQNKTLEYILKPATMLALILAAVLITLVNHDAWQARWFILGFVLSLAGDVFLMLPEPIARTSSGVQPRASQRWFIFGLVAFLLAHLAYVVGLNQTLPPGDALLIYGLIAIVGVALYSFIADGLRRAGQRGLLFPTALYALVITLMLSAAWSTLVRPEWSEVRRAWVITGATLFFLSDALLAWNRFVAPLRAARLAVMITYHLGQIALAASLFE